MSEMQLARQRPCFGQVGRTRGPGFRKACRPRPLTYSPSAQWHRKNSRTCCEGPFAEVLRSTGPMAKANPLRFSTKFQDEETGLLYYGYRYYNASTGRWVSRDAIEEQGGPNQYGFVQNQPTKYIDILGNVRGDDFWPPPPPLPPIDCSGYEKTFGASPCRTCSNGVFGTQKDTYPERAKTICEGFKRRYDGTPAPLHIPASCVAKCLVKKESECQQYGWCDARNCCRLQTHVACYSECGFVPALGMPKGGPALGREELIQACRRMGMSNLDIMISGLF